MERAMYNIYCAREITAILILGMIVAGIGNSPLYALGVPYLDQNVKENVSPMYLGIFVGFGGIY